MNRMQEWLTRAATELQLKMDVDYVVVLEGGQRLVADAYFYDLGDIGGTLVVSWENKIGPDIRAELRRRNIGLSTFDAPGQNETFDIDNYISMFRDWGWTGQIDRKPSWL